MIFERRLKGIVAIGRFIVCIGMVLLLGGCLYPDDRSSDTQGNGLEYVTVVQFAVDQYHERYGVLPIQNSTMDTPLYEKYRIDFKKLLDSPYLSEVPPNAFENGGVNLYVLINVEEQPEVKLLDLMAAQQVNDVKRAIDTYMFDHQDEAPLGIPISAGWYSIDFDKLGIESVQIQSKYSGRFLSLLVNKRGQVIIDYGPDLMSLITEKNLSPQEGYDLRTLLTDNSVYVPVKSVSYYWRNDEPALSAG